MTDLDSKVRKALESVDRSYDEFVNLLSSELRGYPEKQQMLLDFIEAHPGVRSDAVLEEFMENIFPELENDDEYDGEDE